VGERFYEDQLKHMQGNDFISNMQKQRRSFMQAKYQEQKHHFVKKTYFIQRNAADLRHFMT